MPYAPCVERAIHHAPSVSARYYAMPMYLVGSALTSADPRDIDLVVVIPDDLFQAMFEGGTESDFWKRWAGDCAKQSRELTMLCRRQVDFRTQPQKVFEGFVDKPRVRVDGFGG